MNTSTEELRSPTVNAILLNLLQQIDNACNLDSIYGDGEYEYSDDQAVIQQAQNELEALIQQEQLKLLERVEGEAVENVAGAKVLGVHVLEKLKAEIRGE